MPSSHYQNMSRLSNMANCFFKLPHSRLGYAWIHCPTLPLAVWHLNQLIKLLYIAIFSSANPSNNTHSEVNFEEALKNMHKWHNMQAESLMQNKELVSMHYKIINIVLSLSLLIFRSGQKVFFLSMGKKNESLKFYMKEHHILMLTHGLIYSTTIIFISFTIL